MSEFQSGEAVARAFFEAWNAGDTAYGYDDRFPIGDQCNSNRFGVILVRGES